MNNWGNVKEAGFYFGRWAGVAYWNLVLSVQGFAPFFKVHVFDLESNQVFELTDFERIVIGEPLPPRQPATLAASDLSKRYVNNPS